MLSLAQEDDDGAAAQDAPPATPAARPSQPPAQATPALPKTQGTPEAVTLLSTAPGRALQVLDVRSEPFTSKAGKAMRRHTIVLGNDAVSTTVQTIKDKLAKAAQDALTRGALVEFTAQPSPYGDHQELTDLRCVETAPAESRPAPAEEPMPFDGPPLADYE